MYLKYSYIHEIFFPQLVSLRLKKDTFSHLPVCVFFFFVHSISYCWLVFNIYFMLSCIYSVCGLAHQQSAASVGAFGDVFQFQKVSLVHQSVTHQFSFQSSAELSQVTQSIRKAVCLIKHPEQKWKESWGNIHTAAKLTAFRKQNKI